MDAKEINDFMQAHIRRRDALLLKLAAAARSILPVLKDHNLSNTAGELDRLLFEYDANEQEVSNAIGADPDSFIDALFVRFGKPPR